MIFLVPARRGSLRVSGKNTRPVCGKPLIQWTLDAAMVAAREKDIVLVSSDDPVVLDMALSQNLSVAKRLDELCTPTARMSDVILSHLDLFAGHDAVCVLYPTSPLRRTTHIWEAVKLWGGRADTVVMSVAPVLYRPRGLMSLEDTGELVPNRPDWNKYYQAQGQPVDYRANGAIYILPVPLLRQGAINSQLFGKKTVGYVMDEVTSHEVDTELDLKVAEVLMQEALAQVP